MLLKYILIFNQLIIYLAVNLWLFIFFEVEIKSDHINLSKKAKYIVVANHQSKLDPFIIGSLLPTKVKFYMLPYRFLTMPKYMNKKLLGPILFLLGCYSSSTEVKPLKKSQKFLNKNETLFIFPEGKIVKENERDRSAKLGVGAFYLERNNPDVYLFPVKISYLGKRKIEIEYKQPLRHGEFPGDLSLLANQVMDYIYE